MSKYATFGVFQLVGNGVKTNEWCGKFSSYRGCVRVDLHKGVNLLDGTNYTGKAYVEIHNHSCHRPSCPVCYLSWASREAHKIEGRLAEAGKRFGQAEHVVVSIPLWDYGMGYEDLRSKVVKVLESRGVIGGCLIFHGFRIDKKRGVLVWNPHYHVLGFIEGGFDVCRSCSHERDDCHSCSGFKGREVREYEKDRYLVKVLHERKTIFGTIWYQLNHATVRVGLRRFHTVTWFGCCGNRKYGSAKFVPKVQDVCPACSNEMVRCFHAGKRRIVKDVGDAGYVACLVDDEFDESGEPNYVEIVGSHGLR